MQMECSTINPSDMSTANGIYPFTTTPLALGKEGSGTVVKAGGSALACSLLHKRVALRGTGTWADYAVVPAKSVFPLWDSTSFEQAASLIINPMTAALFFDTIQQGGHKAVVQNSAASALGKMLLKLCNVKGIKIVNLVRRQEQVEILREIGAEHVFNTSEEGWKGRVKEVCTELGVTAAFDAVSGEATADIAEVIVNRGVVYNYGRLSGQNCVFGALNLVFNRKRLEGLWLLPWLEEKSYEERMKVGEFVQGLLGEVFETKHARVVNLNQVKDAVCGYRETSATNNKVLIRTKVE